jgi:hypothetical protein
MLEEIAHWVPEQRSQAVIDWATATQPTGGAEVAAKRFLMCAASLLRRQALLSPGGSVNSVQASRSTH